MRKWIRVISALLCLCLLFGLAACGKGESSPGRSPEPKQEPGQSSGQELSTGELETRYKVDSIRLPDPIADSPQKMALYGGKLYVAGQIGDSMDVALYSKTLPDGEWQAMELSTPSLADIAAALGEPPACSGAPAIRNAILNATGVAIDVCPITPHVLYRAFREAGLIGDEREGSGHV